MTVLNQVDKQTKYEQSGDQRHTTQQAQSLVRTTLSKRITLNIYTHIRGARVRKRERKRQIKRAIVLQYVYCMLVYLEGTIKNCYFFFNVILKL